MSGGPNLDIFRSEVGLAPRWVGNAEGIESAHLRMKQVAGEKPGQYFIWDAYLRRVVDRIDSRVGNSRFGKANLQRPEVPFVL